MSGNRVERTWMSIVVAGLIGCAPAARASAPAPVPAGIQMQVPAPRPPEGPDGPITAAQRDEAIEGLLRELSTRYVFPDKGTAVVKAIRARHKRGEYGAIATGHALATALTGHVNEVLRDAHFHVRFSKDPLPPRQDFSADNGEQKARMLEFERQINGGYEKVERLQGNIGYLEVRAFAFPERGFAAAAAAMSFLSETDALIIDLRRNGGGAPEAVAALCSYFFAEPTHLNDLYFRPDNSTRQFWTSDVPGKRYVGRDIYVLTSKRTGSAAEEFAYNLQSLKRATIVGEVTWGGAHPGDMVRLGDHFMAFVPTGRAINPVTKTNWEGVGVKPDIAVAPDDALRVAQLKILEKRLTEVKDPELRQGLEERMKELEAAK